MGDGGEVLTTMAWVALAGLPVVVVVLVAGFLLGRAMDRAQELASLRRAVKREGADKTLRELDTEIALLRQRLKQAEAEEHWTDRWLFRLWRNIDSPDAFRYRLELKQTCRDRLVDELDTGEPDSERLV